VKHHPKLHYGSALVACVIGGLVAAFVMFLPAFIWSHFVVNVPVSSHVGRAEDLATGDRILLYAGDIALIFLAYAIYTASVKGLYRVFQEIELRYWSVFGPLVVTGLIAGLVAFHWPLLGIAIAIFLAPELVNRLAEEDEVPGAGI
jgi:hypothetical protein